MTNTQPADLTIEYRGAEGGWIVRARGVQYGPVYATHRAAMDGAAAFERVLTGLVQVRQVAA